MLLQTLEKKLRFIRIKSTSLIFRNIFRNEQIFTKINKRNFIINEFKLQEKKILKDYFSFVLFVITKYLLFFKS